MALLLCPVCANQYEHGTHCPRDGATLNGPSPDPMIGQLLGRYRVVGQLGSGGMGVVYRAVQTEIRSQVAIKVLSASATVLDPDAVDRFFTEARTVNLIRHENIVSILDLARLPGGRPYLVMELLDGSSLSDLLKRGQLDRLARLRVILDVLAALTAAHAKDVLHRDIKPANVFVSPSGRSKLLDFGIAKVQHMTSLMVFTEAGTLLGTPHYMSPEQARGMPLDPRSDLYAVGVLLYELMTDVLPFAGEATFELLRQHIEDAPVPPRNLQPHLSPQLEQVILTAMAKDPARRFAKAAAMRAALLSIPEASGFARDDTMRVDVTTMAGRDEPGFTTSGATVVDGLTTEPSLPITTRDRPARVNGDARPGPRIADAAIAPPPNEQPRAPAQPASAPVTASAPAATSGSRPRLRWIVAATVFVVGVGILVVINGRHTSPAMGTGAQGTATSPTAAAGVAAPAAAPAGWRAPRSMAEQATALHAKDPEIARWAAGHDPETGAIIDRPTDPPMVDAQTFWNLALARARELAPDAELRSFYVSQMTPDGHFGSQPGATAVFVSAARWHRPSDVASDQPWQPYCVLTFAIVSRGLWLSYASGCEGDHAPIPTCTITEVLARARSQGLSAEATNVMLNYVSPEVGWSVRSMVQELIVTEPCGDA